MTIEEIKKWMLESSGLPVTQANAEYLERFQAIAFEAGAASRDAEVAELVAALKPFGAIDLVESRLPAEFAMLILRARAAIAAAKTQGYSE